VNGSLARRIAGEVIAWLCLPVVFLCAYIGHFGLSPHSILPHCKLVLLCWVFVGACRAVFAAVSRNERTGRAAAALLLSLVLLSIALYYGMVLIGLQSWGQVISWDLIRTYAAQLPFLTDALGISVWWIAVGLAVVYLLLFAAVRAYLSKFDWAPLFVRQVPSRLVNFLCAAGLLLVAIEIAAFPDLQSASADEPVGLTFFPELSAHMLQDHSIDRLGSQRADALQDAARKNYITGIAGPPVNLVLIVVDALRSDHLGVYGYPRATTPNLDAMMRDGTLRAVGGVHASCAESACGLMSLISSR
jgi:glucan phosphoethanolaminetransferase (alkaline phosphatase superfamily)